MNSPKKLPLFGLNPALEKEVTTDPESFRGGCTQIDTDKEGGDPDCSNRRELALGNSWKFVKLVSFQIRVHPCPSAVEMSFFGLETADGERRIKIAHIG